MTRLQLVDDAYLANRGHSVKVAPSLLNGREIADLEELVQSIYRPASRAVADLAEGIADRDMHDVIVALRRLVAIGGIARPSADRLERILHV